MNKGHGCGTYSSSTDMSNDGEPGFRPQLKKRQNRYINPSRPGLLFFVCKDPALMLPNKVTSHITSNVSWCVWWLLGLKKSQVLMWKVTEKCHIVFNHAFHTRSRTQRKRRTLKMWHMMIIILYHPLPTQRRIFHAKSVKNEKDTDSWKLIDYGKSKY